jgi:hypothetical protein
MSKKGKGKVLVYTVDDAKAEMRESLAVLKRERRRLRGVARKLLKVATEREGRTLEAWIAGGVEHVGKEYLTEAIEGLQDDLARTPKDQAKYVLEMEAEDRAVFAALEDRIPQLNPPEAEAINWLKKLKTLADSIQV